MSVENMTAILDIQCVLGVNSKYVIKELSVIDTDSWSTQHWIFKHAFNVQNNKSRSVNKWLERNYHQIPLEYGDVEYEELDRILNSLKFERIYIKGEQKQQMIKEFIPHVYVVNIEELGCPRLDQLCDEESLPCCIFHMNLNPKHCTFRRVFALRKWFINNSSNIL